MSWDDATARLTGPGSPFELTTEQVLGETMEVYAQRAHSLRQLLEQSAVHADKPYQIWDTGQRITYNDLQGVVGSVAQWLSEQGVSKGDRVAILAANCPEWVITYWATVSLGGVVVAMNGWWAADEIRYGLELSEPKILIADRRRLDRLDGADTGCPTVVIEDDFDAIWNHAPGAALPTTDIDEDDPAVLLFTSGTTGRPKGALLSNRNLIGFMMTAFFMGARNKMMDPTVRGVPGRTLCVFPLFHVSGMFSSTVTQLAAGGETVWTTGKFDASKVIALSAAENISSWSGAATHIWRLLEHPDLDNFDTSRLSSVGIGGSATTPELIRATEERFPHLVNTFSSGYGSTETGSLISYATNQMLRDDPTSVGPALPGVGIRVVDAQGDDVPEGTDGEVAVRSPLVMIQYWRNEEANESSFLPGRWFLTGDVGQLRDGHLYLASRKRDLIIRGGENVYPIEIENRLEEHPGVAEVAVFGVDHRTLGQEVKAVVVLAGGEAPSEQDLKDWVGERLAYFKVPEYIEIRTEPMPRNATGKVMKHVLSGDAENTFVEE